MLGELPPVIGVIKIDLLALYKFVDALGGYMDVSFNGNWHQVARILGLAYEHHETVKEVYKEYIGMIKVYYEEAKRMQGKPGIVAGNGRGTADIEGPQVDATMDAEVGETLSHLAKAENSHQKFTMVPHEHTSYSQKAMH